MVLRKLKTWNISSVMLFTVLISACATQPYVNVPVDQPHTTLTFIKSAKPTNEHKSKYLIPEDGTCDTAKFTLLEMAKDEEDAAETTIRIPVDQDFNLTVKTYADGAPFSTTHENITIWHVPTLKCSARVRFIPRSGKKYFAYSTVWDGDSCDLFIAEDEPENILPFEKLDVSLEYFCGQEDWRELE